MQQNTYLEHLKKLGIRFAIFTKDKRPFYKDFIQRDHSIEELSSAIQNGLFIALLNDGQLELADFDRGSKHTQDAHLFKEHYKQLLVSLAEYIGFGLHESTNGFHLIGFPVDLIEGFSEDYIKITKRTKHQCLILPYGRENLIYGDGILHPYTGTVQPLTLAEFCHFLWTHQYVDGYTLELALQHFARENDKDLTALLQETFKGAFDEHQTKRIAERPLPIQPVTFGSVLSRIPKLYAYILRRLLQQASPQKTRKTRHFASEEATITLELLTELEQRRHNKRERLDEVGDIQATSLLSLDEFESIFAKLFVKYRLDRFTFLQVLSKERESTMKLLDSAQKFEEQKNYRFILDHFNAFDFDHIETLVVYKKFEEYFSRLPRQTGLKPLLTSLLNQDLSQLELQILTHFFTNLKKTLVFGYRIFTEPLDPKSILRNRILLNLYGKPNLGKSTIWERFHYYLKKIHGQKKKNIVSSTNAQAIFEDRHTNASTATNVLVVLDELAYLSKIDQNQLKARIDGSSISNRRIHSNTLTDYVNVSNFAGTSNESLEKILSDSTGARRYTEIHLQQRINFDMIQKDQFFDDLFACIDENRNDTYTEEISNYQLTHLTPPSVIDMFISFIKEQIYKQHIRGYVLDRDWTEYQKLQNFSTIYADYREFCKNSGFVPQNAYVFQKTLSEHSLIHKSKSRGYTKYRFEIGNLETSEVYEP